jgi:hypothetical protein
MGEYAIRNSDGQEIKIGTCESMYYIRFEDRFKVSPLRGNIDCSDELDLFWRIPFPDEDLELPGGYWDFGFERSYPLYGYIPADPRDFGLRPHDMAKVHPKCYHSYDVLPGVQAQSNVLDCRAYFFSLASIKNRKDGLKAIIECAGCGKKWAVEIEELLPLIWDEELKKRLLQYKDLDKLNEIKPITDAGL